MKIKIYIFAFVASCLYSCGEKPYYEAYVEIPENGWQQDSIITFDVTVEDTSSGFVIQLNLRNNSQYPYRNIFLFREIRSNRGIEFRDTVEYPVADAYGKWLGDGLGDLKTHQWPFSARALHFRRSGRYTFSIQQAMREEMLKGVEDVGITIFKTSSSEEKENGQYEEKR
ncbi:MAG: gliding motility lipoprotein GldH [Owenweeksia sp.]